MKAPLFCLLSLSFVAFPAIAKLPSCDGGIVFEDANGNRLRDPGEAGLPGIKLSDGEAVVETDSNGRFSGLDGSGRTVVVNNPAGV